MLLKQKSRHRKGVMSVSFGCVEFLRKMPRRDFWLLLSALSASNDYSEVSVLGAKNVSGPQKLVVAGIFREHGVDIGDPANLDFDEELDAAIGVFNRRAAERR